MYSNNSNGIRAASARGFMALFAMLAMGLGLMASPAEAAPFAYIANDGDGTVSVIDAATNTVMTGTGFPVPVGTFPVGVAVTPDGKHVYVANARDGTVSVIDTTTNPNTVGTPIPVGIRPFGVAITPDGKHAYVANESDGTVSVIETTGNTVMTTITVGSSPLWVAVTPDGKHVYVTNSGSNDVSVIETTGNTVMTTITAGVGNGPAGVAVTPDGKHVYVVNDRSGTVSVIETITNTVITGPGFPIPVGTFPDGVAVTPDGKHVYVANARDGTVSVIDTTGNTVMATVGVGGGPRSIAITPDGKHAYVTNSGSNDVSVIDTGSNTVVAGPPTATPFTVGNTPLGAGIMPPPQGVPFLAFSAQLQIHFGRRANTDIFTLQSSFTLSSTAPAIDPVAQVVTLQVGIFTAKIPPGSFKKNRNGSFTFVGVIGGVSLQAVIAPTGTLRYAFVAAAQRASLTGTTNPMTVTLAIGADMGTTSVKARFF